MQPQLLDRVSILRSAHQVAKTAQRRRRLAAHASIAVTLLSFASLPLQAAAGDRWIVRAHGLILSTSGDPAVAPRETAEGIEQISHEVGNGSGFGLSLEFLINGTYGEEIGIYDGDLDSDLSIDNGSQIRLDSADTGWEIYTLGCNYHFTPSPRIGVSLGAFAAITFFDDTFFFTGGGSEKLTFDDDYGIGLKVGLDIPLGANSGWLLTAEGRYLSTILETEGLTRDIEINPLILAAGVGYRF